MSVLSEWKYTNPISSSIHIHKRTGVRVDMYSRFEGSSCVACITEADKSKSGEEGEYWVCVVVSKIPSDNNINEVYFLKKNFSIEKVKSIVDSGLKNQGYEINDKTIVLLPWTYQEHYKRWVRELANIRSVRATIYVEDYKTQCFGLDDKLADQTTYPNEGSHSVHILFLKDTLDNKLKKLGYQLQNNDKKNNPIPNEIPLGEPQPCNLGLEENVSEVFYDHPLTRLQILEIYSNGLDPYAVCSRCRCVKDPLCGCESTESSAKFDKNGDMIKSRKPLEQDTRYEPIVVYSDDQSEPP